MRSDRAMFIRGISVAVLVMGLVLLTACGSSYTPPTGGGTVTIGLTASVTTLSPGQATTVTAVVSKGGVSWSSSPAGFGALSGQTSTSVTYTAPAAVPAPTLVTITATSTTSSSVVAPVQVAVQPAITVSLSPVGAQTINQGQQQSVNATVVGDATGVTWTLSPASGAGSLSNVTLTSVTYTAPGSVTSSIPVTLTATSKANAGSTAVLELTAVGSGAGTNVAALTTAVTPAGLLTIGTGTNAFFTSVTICVPATTNCQTIDNVLVDTGSEGLRLLQSQLTSLVLPQLSDGVGDYLNNCITFLDGSYLWGAVALADVKFGGETAGNAPLQLISSSNTGVPTACSNGGTVNSNTPQLLGANGILGVGLEPTDCTLAGGNFCDGSQGGSIPNIYFVCPTSGCALTDTSITTSAGNQVVNPVVAFGSDNNGTALKLGALSGAATVADGSMIFGIGTQSNNGLGTAKVFGLDGQDNFITLFSGQTLTASFIDSGSNGLFFPSTITACTVSAGFYCPATIQNLTASQEDPNAPVPVPVNFSIDNADSLFSNQNNSAYSTLGGPLGTVNTCSGNNGSCTFDWGAPFFYGKTVFTAIDGQNTPAGLGPFWAY
jgi:hypothetical protein